jgi:hypothetical protein
MEAVMESFSSATLSDNMQWLLDEMEKLALDVNDREIIKRFAMFALRTDYDLAPQTVQELRFKKQNVNEAIIPEPLLPFYRHYQFMKKRKSR